MVCLPLGKDRLSTPRTPPGQGLRVRFARRTSLALRLRVLHPGTTIEHRGMGYLAPARFAHSHQETRPPQPCRVSHCREILNGPSAPPRFRRQRRGGFPTPRTSPLWRTFPAPTFLVDFPWLARVRTLPTTWSVKLLRLVPMTVTVSQPRPWQTGRGGAQVTCQRSAVMSMCVCAVTGDVCEACAGEKRHMLMCARVSGARREDARDCQDTRRRLARRIVAPAA
jgi:hypothetical protein